MIKRILQVLFISLFFIEGMAQSKHNVHIPLFEQAWVQYGSNGAEIRDITSASNCPGAQVDGKYLRLNLRAKPNSAYPLRVCQLNLPENTKKVSILGRPLNVPKSDPNTIIILGDTGCRMKGSNIQACNDPVAWPFSLVSEVIAQQKPDLIIHVGDYHYRETACPTENDRCSGSPWGDNLPAWQADLLQPAATALRIAPWVFVRGNHEDCTRAGQGWTRLLDPQPFSELEGCTKIDAPWVVRLNGLTLGVIDNATVSEGAIDGAATTRIRQDLTELTRLAGNTPMWLLMHRPVRNVRASRENSSIEGNATLAAAVDATAPHSLSYIISGHQHSFQFLNWQDGSASQIIVGQGGSLMDTDSPQVLDGKTVLNKTISSGLTQEADFGFVVLKRQTMGWQLTNRNRFGEVTLTCQMTQIITCTEPDKKK